MLWVIFSSTLSTVSRCSCLSCWLYILSFFKFVQPDTVTGDIVFVLQQKEHPKFKRKGDDLFVEHTLSLTEALCGFQFVITHLDGRQLLIKSQPGEVVKLGKYNWMDVSLNLSAFVVQNWVCWIISSFYKLFNFTIGNILSDLWADRIFHFSWVLTVMPW